ncbi:MAG: DUF1572 domain-containing protein [Aureispira sp.]
MSTTHQIALHCEQVFFGGNWTASNLQEHLADVTWEEALTSVYDFNTIATLTYHIYYYIKVALPVFNGEALDAHDKFSFDHPPITSSEDWERFKAEIWRDTKAFVEGVRALPDHLLPQDFSNKKYGSYYRNLLGTVEHSHYHLGQLVLIKKIIRQL